jgi:hypothetical protein
MPWLSCAHLDVNQPGPFLGKNGNALSADRTKAVRSSILDWDLLTPFQPGVAPQSRICARGRGREQPIMALVKLSGFFSASRAQ